jgi:hypothetical protein
MYIGVQITKMKLQRRMALETILRKEKVKIKMTNFGGI